MGAGCNYTNDIDSSKSCWVEIKNVLTENKEDIYKDDFDHTLNFDLFYESLIESLSELFKKDKTYSIGENCLESTCYKIEFESSYYGDSIVFNMKENYSTLEHICWNNEGQYNLIINNAEKSYLRVMRKIQKYFELHTSSSCWTSRKVEL